MDSEKHCHTKITLNIEQMRNLWVDCTDNQRMEIIKSVVWTAPDMHEFYQRVKKEIVSDKFEETLD